MGIHGEKSKLLFNDQFLQKLNCMGGRDRGDQGTTEHIKMPKGNLTITN